MRYRIEILYNDNTFDTLCTNKYCEVVHLINNIKLLPTKYKDIRVYKLIGQYKNKNENMEIQHND